MPSDHMIPSMKPARDANPRRGGKKLLTLIILFFVTVLVLLFFQSSLSKITEIRIEGNELLSRDQVMEATGLHIGDHFFTTGVDKIRSRLQAQKAVQSVKVTKHFPGVIAVTVVEQPRVGFQLAGDGTREVLLADGSALPIVGDASHVSMDMPILSGWSDQDPNKTKLCQALASIPAHLLSDISEIKPDPSTAYQDKIKMYTRSRFEVYTTIEYLPGNMEYLGYITNELKDQGKNDGVITMLEQIRHAPFSSISSTGEPAS